MVDELAFLLRILKVLDVLDAVLDVGAVYDPIRDRFDHHQKGFVDVFGHGFGNKLSSAGLVYKVLALIFTFQESFLMIYIDSMELRILVCV